MKDLRRSQIGDSEFKRFYVLFAGLSCAVFILLASAQGTVLFTLPGIIVLAFLARDDFGENFQMRRALLYLSLIVPSACVSVCIFLIPGPGSAHELPPANIVVSNVIEHFWWLGLLPHIFVPFFLKRDWWKSVIASLALLPAYFLIIFVAVMSIRSDFI